MVVGHLVEHSRPECYYLVVVQMEHCSAEMAVDRMVVRRHTAGSAVVVVRMAG